MARSILRKFSAWRSSLDENGIAPILVTPSTMCAISPPKQLVDALGVVRVSSTTSWQEAGGDRGDVQLHIARKSATSSGWTR
jgi:hypothetical protein